MTLEDLPAKYGQIFRTAQYLWAKDKPVYCGHYMAFTGHSWHRISNCASTGYAAVEYKVISYAMLLLQFDVLFIRPQHFGHILTNPNN